ncbi:hypothetical protein L0337_23435 [candidate division KSB1 bacterium]|nr:hypothetical protein [candidate division KSB1 bacterium]
MKFIGLVLLFFSLLPITLGHSLLAQGQLRAELINFPSTSLQEKSWQAERSIKFDRFTMADGFSQSVQTPYNCHMTHHPNCKEAC